MTLLNRLERTIGFLSIGHLPIFIVSAQAVVYVWSMINPEGFSLLVFDPMAIIYGHEYWRLLTSLFVIPLQNPLWAFLFLYMLYTYGTALENDWGSFSFTMFYLVGVIGVYVAGFMFGSVNGAFFLNITIFLAFAAVHADSIILLFFVLPLRVKWIALFIWASLAYEAFKSPVYTRAAILCSVANYFLFFGWKHVQQVRDTIRHIHHRQRYKNWN